MSLQSSSPKTSAPDSSTRSTSPQLEIMIFLMKFQVAEWQFPHQGCVGTKQGLLGAPAVPRTCGSAAGTHLFG